MEPNDPKNVTIGGIEATPADIRPSRKRGDEATVEVVFNSVSAVAYYRLLKRYEEYAGEADTGQLLGGKPYVREHPLDQWPVDSHIVPIVYGAELAEEESFWGVITAVSDDSRYISDTETGDESYGVKAYGIEPYGEAYEPNGNYYRLALEIVKLAVLGEYDDRGELLADLNPTVSQL